MIFVLHLDVGLWKTLCPVLLEELAVAAVKNVDLRVGQLWIPVSVHHPVVVTDELGHQRSPMLRVLAVEDEQRSRRTLPIEELLCE